MAKRVTAPKTASVAEAAAEPTRSPDAPWLAPDAEEPGPAVTPATILPIPAAIEATAPIIPDPRDAEIVRMREALEEIAEPLKVWGEQARKLGRTLAAIHYPRAHNADVLKAIARQALGREE